jgi:4'-phosphopantetheinyl transferase
MVGAVNRAPESNSAPRHSISRTPRTIATRQPMSAVGFHAGARYANTGREGIDERTFRLELRVSWSIEGPAYNGFIPTMTAASFAIPVEVWRIQISAEPVDRWREFLLPDEVARADRFVFPADRNRFTVTRGVLRSLLQPHLPVGARPVEFVFNQWGKPEIPGGGPRFNVTHSGDFALIAIAQADVGVDIEQTSSLRRVDDLAASVFTNTELARFECLRGDARTSFFFRTWTCKEALIKAAGAGLSIPVDRIQIDFTPEGASVLAPPGTLPPGPWSLHELDAPEEYTAAVAVRADAMNLKIRDCS